MGDPRLSSNSESRIDSLEGVTHSDLRAIYSPQLMVGIIQLFIYIISPIQIPSTSSNVPSLRPSSIARVQSMPPHQSQVREQKIKDQY